MALNAITTSGAQAIPQVGLIPAISQIVQSFLDVAGVDTPDRLFDVLSRFAPESPGLAAAPYINALRNVSVSVHTACCCADQLAVILQVDCMSL